MLLYGIIGALVLRAVFIALGAAALQTFDWTFLVFGLVLVVTGVKILRDTLTGQDHEVDVDRMRSVRLVRRVVPVTPDYESTRLLSRIGGRRALTPLALVSLVVLATDIVFAIDSVPAVYGITGDPFLVFATNAFALLGLRALYFVLEGALGRLVHLGYGLAAILGFIGVKLALHWAHLQWAWCPRSPPCGRCGRRRHPGRRHRDQPAGHPGPRGPRTPTTSPTSRCRPVCDRQADALAAELRRRCGARRTG